LRPLRVARDLGWCDDVTIEALVGFCSPILLRPGVFLCTLDYEPARLYIRNIIPDDMGIPSPAVLAERGVAMCYSPEFVEWDFSEVRKESCNKYCN
jgi:hypothetical protein